MSVMNYINKLYKVEKLGNGIVKITLDNPPVNAITLDVTAEQIDTLLKIDKDNDIRIVILTAAGTKAFCAGSDIKEFPDVWDDVIYKKLKKENEAYNLIEQISKPVIAAIEGLAYGG